MVICTLSKKMEHGIVPMSYLAGGTFLFNKVEDLVHLQGLKGGVKRQQRKKEGFYPYRGIKETER